MVVVCGGMCGVVVCVWWYCGDDVVAVFVWWWCVCGVGRDGVVLVPSIQDNNRDFCLNYCQFSMKSYVVIYLLELVCKAILESNMFFRALRFAGLRGRC